ncbi:MAG: hypothetical protein H7Z18_11520 [Methylophilaceae bacterium]|nr:hypothetical protein [Methylophilaceae bacterium]
MMTNSRILNWLIKINLIIKYRLKNRFSNAAIVSNAPVVVSLTSYGERTSKVFYAIESIANGKVLPSRIILWLDNEHQFNHLPAELKRLKSRGLEIFLAENYGPHTKYFPYVNNLSEHVLPLVTADDDIFYPIFWLKNLYESYVKTPSVVNCYRAHVVLLDKEQQEVESFKFWQICSSTDASYFNQATGVSGVIYPPDFLNKIKASGDVFLACCPNADDIWLHAIALRNGYQVKQIEPEAYHFLTLPFTQKNGLFNANIFLGLNDKQAKMTYNRSDINTLKQDAPH